MGNFRNINKNVRVGLVETVWPPARWVFLLRHINNNDSARKLANSASKPMVPIVMRAGIVS